MGNIWSTNAGVDETGANKRARIQSPPSPEECNNDLEGVAAARSSPKILDLPFELLLSVFQWLDHSEISKCARVCKRFNEVSKDPQLFRDVQFSGEISQNYTQWVMHRAIYPKKFNVSGEKCPALISIIQLGPLNVLEELYLEFVYLNDIGESAFENLKILSIISCTLNCKTSGKLLHQSKKICSIYLDSNKCSHCGVGCDAGHLPVIDFEVFRDSIEDMAIRNSCEIPQQHLHQLSACINLKSLRLCELSSKGVFLKEAVLAMEMVGRKCLKLERVKFWSLDFITDDFLATFFKNRRNLKNVYLCHLPKITEESCLNAIDALPQLQIIFIQQCPLIPQSSEIELMAAIEKLNTRTPPKLTVC